MNFKGKLDVKLDFIYVFNQFMPEVVIFWICAWNSYMLPRKFQGTRIWREKKILHIVVELCGVPKMEH